MDGMILLGSVASLSCYTIGSHSCRRAPLCDDWYTLFAERTSVKILMKIGGETRRHQTKHVLKINPPNDLKLTQLTKKYSAALISVWAPLLRAYYAS